MSNTLNTFQIQLAENLGSSSTSTLVYSIDNVSPSNAITSPTISASYTTLGGLTIMQGTFSGTTSALNQLAFANITVEFSNPVFTSTPKVFLQAVAPSGTIATGIPLLIDAYTITTDGFSFGIVPVPVSLSGYSGTSVAVNFLLIGS